MKIIKLLLLAAVLPLATARISIAQQAAEPPAAPIPWSILSSKKVFLTNASGETPLPAGTAALAYNMFYAEMKNWGHFELVSAPADAELTFELRFKSFVSPIWVTQGGGNSAYIFCLTVTIIDTKTRTILWVVSEPVPQSGNKTKSRISFNQSMSTVLDDLKNLILQYPTATPDPKN